jgi:methyl-accepting chemotaxis protein
MQWLYNLSTSTKLLGAIGLLGVIILAVGWLAVSQLGILHTNTNEVYKNGLLPLVALSDIQDDVQRLRQDTYRLSTTSDPKELSEIIDAARALDRDLLERNKQYLAQVMNEADRTAFVRYQEALADWRRDREEKLYPQVLAGQKEAAYQTGKDLGPRYELTIKLIKEIIQAKQQSALKIYENSEDVVRSGRITLLMLAAAGLVIGLVLALIIPGQLRSESAAPSPPSITMPSSLPVPAKN